MRHALKLHPDGRCAGVAGIDVEVARPRAGVLTLRYVVTGEINALRLPERSASARADELWRHTCFEAFVSEGAGYHEFNFAPSTQWAAYSFDSYRAGMRNADKFGAPRIDLRIDDDRLALSVELDMPADITGRLGLTAVIEETDGNVSYWALAHPPGRADFHHADGFAIDLAATDLT
ncbi:MAG: DOMON-like domain-containing protein [Hyphomonadaceae bacterium]|nr:DOMON-like domain-containing protein [Hyphomonadaceae bacterium]